MSLNAIEMACKVGGFTNLLTVNNIMVVWDWQKIQFAFLNMGLQNFEVMLLHLVI